MVYPLKGIEKSLTEFAWGEDSVSGFGVRFQGRRLQIGTIIVSKAYFPFW